MNNESSEINEVMKAIESKSIEEKSIEVVKLLINRKLKITSAESCTGGLFASSITSVSGSSECFEGSFVTYSNEIKHRIINVKKQTLEKYGAVSEECVLEMAENTRKIMKSDISISISGIAGPSGGTADKPVGLVWICLAAEGYIKAYKNIFSGDRQSVREQSVLFSLSLVENFIKKC
nr:CinA family protein [Brachyspira hampsonii]